MTKSKSKSPKSPATPDADPELLWDCPREIGLVLESKGVPMEGCPPMFYPPGAIHNLELWLDLPDPRCLVFRLAG